MATRLWGAARVGPPQTRKRWGVRAEGASLGTFAGGAIERRPRAVESHFRRGLQGSGMFLDEPWNGKREKPHVAGPFPRAPGVLAK